MQWRSALKTTIMAGAAALLSSVAFADDESAPLVDAAPAIDPNYNTKNLGDGFFTRLINYYKLEWGHEFAPPDPSALSSRRAGDPPQPVNAPPMPFIDWPYGGTTTLGANRTASVDSPLMVALGDGPAGKMFSDWGVQAYGWLAVGGNLSTNTQKGGNSPGAYYYQPNRFDLDQAVLYIERTPDTVQKDHIDWGFRVAGIYGSDYRYTTAYGLWSYQLLHTNNVQGYDAPMVYGEIFVPQIMEGFMVRFGRFIALPDIEAQLAPNNYMYSHSLGYTFDNYTNTGVQTSLALTKNWIVQFGISVGSDTMPWNSYAKLPNPYPNVLYPNATMYKDPGAIPSYTGCVRWSSDSSYDNVYVCGDALNNGVWGYNNLQWLGGTYFHKFNDQWHIGFETWNIHLNKVPNELNPEVQAIVANGGTPFSNPASGILSNAPNMAQCANPTVLTCTTHTQMFLTYLNYQFSKLDNISYRAEFFDDYQGQRTGVKTRYFETGIGWQHWFSPQIEVRPEVTFYRAFDAPAFNANNETGAPPNKNNALVVSSDLIWHF
ncbi:outer membrane beta-barrel protein [Rhodoblastus sp.]|uniref:outer membrane beta-barrel protein n=1 Tax=Rhodoblastus sp. TaxID=1962975 RepID=UPI003F95A0A7